MKTNLRTCAPNKNSNQPAYPHCPIRTFVVRVKKHCILGYQKSAHGRFWLDCANTQINLNLRCAQMSVGTSADVAVHFLESHYIPSASDKYNDKENFYSNEVVEPFETWDSDAFNSSRYSKRFCIIFFIFLFEPSRRFTWNVKPYCLENNNDKEHGRLLLLEGHF